MKKTLITGLTRIISALLLLSLACCFFPCAASASADAGELEFQIVLPEATAKASRTAKVQVIIKNPTTYEITDVSYTLVFDKTKLSYVSDSVEADENYSQSTVVASDAGISVKYIARNREKRRPIPANGQLALTFTFNVASQVTDAETVKFTIADSQILMRASIDSLSTDAANISHTFTVKTTPTGTLILKVLGSNANLTSITPYVNNTATPLWETFSANVLNYTFYANKPLTYLDFKAVLEDSNATFSWDGSRNAEGKLIVTEGDNVYKLTVTAENGTTKKEYTVTMKLLAEGAAIPTRSSATSSSTSATTTSSSDASSTTTTTTTTDTTTSTSAVSDSDPSSTDTPPPGNDDGDDDGDGLQLSLFALLGIVIAEIGLFMLAFLSGYMTHKNASKPPKITLDDLVAAKERMGMDGFPPPPVNDGFGGMDDMSFMMPMDNSMLDPGAYTDDQFMMQDMGMMPPDQQMGADYGIPAGSDAGLVPPAADAEAAPQADAASPPAPVSGAVPPDMGASPGFGMQPDMGASQGFGMQPDMGASQGFGMQPDMGASQGFGMQPDMGASQGFGMQPDMGGSQGFGMDQGYPPYGSGDPFGQQY